MVKKTIVKLPKNYVDPHLKDYLKYTYAERLLTLTKMNELARKYLKRNTNSKVQAMRLIDLPPEKKMKLLKEIHKTIIKSNSKRKLKQVLKRREKLDFGKYRSSEWK